MTIIATAPFYHAGTLVAAGPTQLNYSADREAALVREGKASYVGSSPQTGGAVPVSAVTDPSTGAASLVGAGGAIIPIEPPAYTWSAIPDATTADHSVLIRITDVGVSAFGSLWYTDGTRWRPVGDRLVLGNVAFAGTTNGTSAETIGYEVALPAGLLQSGDEISVAPYVFKTGGTSDTGTINARLGAVSGTLGSQLWLTASQPATTNLRVHATWAWRKASATLLSFASVGGATAGGITINAQADATVPDMDTQITYLQVTTKLATGGTEMLTLKSCPVILQTY